jgi:hypothetical protein
MRVENPENENPENEIPEHIKDIQSLTRTALQKKYKGTYSSWKNSKSRAKPHGHWDPEFDDFGDFLRIMGPRTGDQTLDRIDTNNPFYGPGLCQWLDKKGQANNRLSTIFVEHKGSPRPLSEVALENGQNPDAVRHRRQRGWTDQEALTGKRSRETDQFGRDPRTFKPWPYPGDVALQEMWENEFLEEGGLKKFKNRFEYALSRVGNYINSGGRWLSEHSAEMDDDTPLDIAPCSVDEYEKMSARQSRMESYFEKLKADYELWKKAVARFEAIEYERDLLRRSRRYRYPSPDDDWDDWRN